MLSSFVLGNMVLLTLGGTGNGHRADQCVAVLREFGESIADVERSVSRDVSPIRAFAEHARDHISVWPIPGNPTWNGADDATQAKLRKATASIEEAIDRLGAEGSIQFRGLPSDAGGSDVILASRTKAHGKWISGGPTKIPAGSAWRKSARQGRDYCTAKMARVQVTHEAEGTVVLLEFEVKGEERSDRVSVLSVMLVLPKSDRRDAEGQG